MKHNLGYVVLALFLVGCAQNLTVEQKMCRMAIEDVFLPVNKLDINDVGLMEKESEIHIPIEYSIVDATGKRVEDIAICTFDKSAEAKVIKTILQFNNEIPAPYVQFINKRVARKMLAAAGKQPPAEEEKPPAVIPAPAVTMEPPPAAEASPPEKPAAK